MVRTSSAYFTRLELKNVRSFGDRQCLDLKDHKGRPAQWTLIVGDNGVGKTTILQCLASMRPVIAAPAEAESSSDPNRLEPALFERENDQLLALARMGQTDIELVVELTSASLTGRRATAKDYCLKAQIKVDGIELVEVGLTGYDVDKPFEPLVIAYGAARHLRYGSPAMQAGFPDGTESIFDPAVELVDPVEILEGLDYSAAKKQPGAKELLKRIKMALVQVLPSLEKPTAIKLYGPAPPGSKTSKRGVQVVTVFGEVPLAALSLGYQTMTAWIVDLAWRLYQRYPNSKNALREPAIVLIDEIDLHLHPRWQRTLRESVVEAFPKVQFIATGHSPILAQSYLGMNLAVVREQNGQAVIDSDPNVAKTWRIDEVVTSALYELDSAFSPEIAAKLKLRRDLLQKTRRTFVEERKLLALNKLVEEITPQASPEDEHAMSLIRRAAELIDNR